MMEKRFKLVQHGSHLWTREKGRQIRSRLAAVLETLGTGDVLVVDAAGVEAFDFSFASELFGKTLLTLGAEYPGRFVIAENLTECTNENLDKALEILNLTMIEQSQGKLKLLSKVHPADHQTFPQIVGAAAAVSPGALSTQIDVHPTAMNERLSKLTNLVV